MVAGLVLILAVVLLGGGIATLGDRIGMRVGKARLSLFNLRPRQTATLVSIATGSVISASTLALLFGVSSQLRTGVFELGEIQADLESAQANLKSTQDAKAEVESELAAATEEQDRARSRLREINQYLQSAVEQQQTTQAQLRRTQNQLSQVTEQTATLRSEIQQLQSERENLRQQQVEIQAQIQERDAEIAERDAEIADRDAEIAERDIEIARRERRLAELENTQQFLAAEIAELEKQYEGLFRGNIALARNQELVSGVVRVDNVEKATQVVNQLLFEANRTALGRIAPGTPLDRQVLFIENREVERIISRISDGQPYVIRILSAANYVIGESCVTQSADPCVQVFADVVPNQLIYQAGERLASTSAEDVLLSDRQIVERLNLLIAATQFRARQDGVVGDSVQISDNRTETLLQFLESVKNYGQPLVIQAVAANPIYTVGPIRIELVALSNGRLLFWTGQNAAQTGEQRGESIQIQPDNPGF